MTQRMLAIVFFALLMSAPVSAEDDVGKADAALNASYEALLSHLDSAAQQQLREAQRAWLTFRDKECGFRSHKPAPPTVMAACLAELAQQRAEALDRERARGAGTVGASETQASCTASVGKAISDTLVRQCMQVSPATHPPCNADNACELIRDEIKRGCAMIDKEDAPAFCAGFRT